MNVIGGRVVLSPSDLVGFLACPHLAQLEVAAAREGRPRPVRVDAELDLRVQLGERHEAAQLARMIAEGRRIVSVGDHAETVEGLRAAEAETLAAMRSGADVVYQAAFFDGTWRGRADFLLRVETPSVLGAWSYEVADAKLARSVKVSALLQMCEYSLQVARLQSLPPEHMHVLLGSGQSETHRVDDYAAYHRAARRRLESAVESPVVDTYPEPVEHCNVCRWVDRCSRRRRDDDHLSLVAGMRRDHTRKLRDAGIGTVASLAVAPAQRSADMGEAPWQRLRQQARLQVHERVSGEQRYELLAPERDGLGLAALPSPSPGDLFFDMEGDPYVLDGGLEYLFGAVEITAGAPRFHAFWAHDRAEEKAAFEALVDMVIDRLGRDPSLHVYHYASYEPAALKRLMGRHATREDEVDRLLRGGVLVDLYRVVTQGLRISKDSYSIKKLESFYMPRRSETIADAAASIVAYERWMESRDRSLLDGIAAYNQRDCVSTWKLRDWLEQRRAELAASGVAVARPERRDAEPSEVLAAAAAETRALVDALTDGIPADAALRSGPQRAQWLLAQLLDWHRREDKSAWWAYYARTEMSDEQLVEDSEAIGSLVHAGALRIDKRSTVHAYTFDPAQEHKLDPGDKPHDPRTQAGCGEIVAIDNDAGTLELKRGPSLDGVAHPTALMPSSPIPTPTLRRALRRVAEAVLESGGVDGAGRYAAVRDLLLARTPRLRATLPGLPLVQRGEDAVRATCRLVAELDESYLAVQGPPGCGKTHTGAEVIVALVRSGRRVGVSATTHRAIANMLSKVGEVAAAQRQPVRILQKCDESQLCASPQVRRAASNEQVVAELEAGAVDVVAGTPWLFADERLDGALDVLVVDEAGQMSLANVCAVGTAARNLVLLGDPQQLAQPSQGVHPEGAERSALDHVLDGHDTVPEHRGVFLPTTRRMHPDVCVFVSDAFYDGRLTAHHDCAQQQLYSDAPLHATGTHVVAVDHDGNRTASPEEVAAVRALVDRLDGARWIDARGVTRPVTAADILVVAPYNAQVKRLRSALDGRAHVGTVDRFQGQEGAITVYSMATSSAEEIPRGPEFLFSRNRLNVAVSRARCVAVVVCAPELLQVRCRTPEQLRLVNALCLYVEMAHPVGPQPAIAATHGV
ncbi:MAG TPA: TM0106 family RecB-like putative nuclease [Candidatus Angelobacter sp.]|jgi:predicted RecB family nuclease|nr:TM0106 family RecB-like putative nuclease [Candidatus Angelobacter sp.]